MFEATIEEKHCVLSSLKQDRFDAAIAPGFKASVEGLIKDGHKNIIVDLSNIKFMDSSALGALVNSMKLTTSEGKFVICGASGVVLDLFKLTRMDSVLNLQDDLEKCVESMEG